MASKSSSWSDVWDRNGMKVAHGCQKRQGTGLSPRAAEVTALHCALTQVF